MTHKLITSFIIGSLLGWIAEVVGVLITSGEFVNRGFLYGPFLPIYGIGGVLFILLFHSKKYSIIYIFIVGMIIASIIEYFTSYLLELIFNDKWWDYSYYSFNLHGRIALWSSICFGIAAIFTMKVIWPLVNLIYKKSRNNFLKIINWLFLLYFIIDLTLSVIKNST